MRADSSAEKGDGTPACCACRSKAWRASGSSSSEEGQSPWSVGSYSRTEAASEANWTSPGACGSSGGWPPEDSGSEGDEVTGPAAVGESGVDDSWAGGRLSGRTSLLRVLLRSFDLAEEPSLRSLRAACGLFRAAEIALEWSVASPTSESVSYTHLTLPTICSV